VGARQAGQPALTSTSGSSAAPADVVARLRAAGCVFAEEEARLLLEAAGTPGELAVLVDRRVAGVPLEHVLGWVEFCGLRVAVDPGVFVPRRRTELLVSQAAALVTGPGAVVVDLCCGSAAVAAALAAVLDRPELYAVDIDPVAVRSARRNLDPVGGRVLEGDLYEPLPELLRGRVDVLVANTPYVPSESVATMPPEARDHEPLVALDGGEDGLDVQRAVAARAAKWLAPGGHLLVETSESQAPQLVEIFEANRLAARVARSSELHATVVIGTLTPTGSDSQLAGQVLLHPSANLVGTMTVREDHELGEGGLEGHVPS
jgi:release factor glutamine methyltransferase